MDYETLEKFRRTLLGRRASLLERRRHALLAESDLLTTREPDWPDAASVSSTASVLESLSESDRLALERIRASLQRIGRGFYDTCAVCRGRIDERRLRAIPDTDRCASCADACE